MSDPSWLSLYYTPSKDMDKQYRSPAFEARIKTMPFHYANAILAQYEDIARISNQIRTIIDQIYNEPTDDSDKRILFHKLEMALQKRRSDDGEDWYTECPSVWYQSSLASIINPAMTHIDLVVCKLGTAAHIQIGWDIII